MHLTALVESLCLWSSGIASLPFLLGLNHVISVNPSFTWVRTPFSAAVVRSREIHWVLWGLPCLSIHFERMNVEVPGLALNAWYLDDGILFGSPEDLVAVLHIVKGDSPPLDLYLNRGKSLLFIP